MVWFNYNFFGGMAVDLGGFGFVIFLGFIALANGCLVGEALAWFDFGFEASGGFALCADLYVSFLASIPFRFTFCWFLFPSSEGAGLMATMPHLPALL